MPIAGSRLSWSLAVALAVGGCTPFQPEMLSPASSAARLEARTLHDPRLLDFLRASGTADPAAPWDLGRLTLAALYFHPDLAVARARVAGAEADVITAGQRPNPTLNLGAGIDTAAAAGAIPAGALPLTVGPLVDLVIETFGKREDRTAQARALVDAARAELALAAWQMRGRVRDALLADWAAAGRAASARARAELHRHLVSLTEQRVEAGQSTARELSGERSALGQATLAVVETERQGEAARVQLAGAIGVPVAALDGVTLSHAAFDHPIVPAPDEVARRGRRRALTLRADIRAALAEYAAAQAALRLQLAYRYPNLTLGAGYEYDAGLNRFSLSPSLELPIFNQNEGPIARAVADRQLAAARFTALQARIIGELDSAALQYRATTRALEIADALADEDQRDLQEAREIFAAGQSDRPTLVAVELEAEESKAARFDALVRQREAAGALEDALQQPLLTSATEPSS